VGKKEVEFVLVFRVLVHY